MGRKALFIDGNKLAHAFAAIGYHVLQESYESIALRAFQSGRSEMVFKKIAPEVFNEGRMYSCSLKKWKGINIVKNIVKIAVSTKIVLTFMSKLIKLASLLGFDAVTLKLLHYIEFAQRIRGTRAFP